MPISGPTPATPPAAQPKQIRIELDGRSELAPVARAVDVNAVGQELPEGTKAIFMFAFLAALFMLFAGSVVAYLYQRLQIERWPPAGMPALPQMLWASTALLVVSSATIHVAYRALLGKRTRLLAAFATLTFAIGLAFLALQIVAWAGLIEAGLGYRSNPYGFWFYFLTALHAVHVIGGLIPLGIVTVKAIRRRYSPYRPNNVGMVVAYWHFLDAVWVALFVLVFLT